MKFSLTVINLKSSFPFIPKYDHLIILNNENRDMAATSQILRENAVEKILAH